MNLGTYGKVAQLTKILGEVDLAAIQRESTRRFTLLVAGEEGARAALAEALSREEGKTGVHPWLRQVSSFDSEDPHSCDMAIVALPELEPDPETGAFLQRMHAAGVPTLSVVLGGDAGSQAGASLPRPQEQRRVLLPDLTPPTVEAVLIPALLSTAAPELHLSMARHLPALRSTHAQTLIEETARANAFYAASSGLASVVPILNIPLGVADAVVLTKNQLIMAYKLALAGGKEGSPTILMGEVAGVLGGGLLFRQLARELVGLVPVIGIVPNVAVAYAGTRVIGQAVRVWITQGTRLEPSEMRRGYLTALDAGRSLARSFVMQGRRFGKNRRGPKAEPRALPGTDKSEEPVKASEADSGSS